MGPPGTGKTMLAKALANQCKDAMFFNIHSSRYLVKTQEIFKNISKFFHLLPFYSLASKWRGDSEKLVRLLFELAQYNAPSIIFIDEIEAILSERGCQGEHEASKRAKAEFLIHLDGLQNFAHNTSSEDSKPVLFLASTNLPWTLDPAILRRFQTMIHVPLPNASERLEILKKCLQGRDISLLDLKALANSDTCDFSGKI